jgi:hypothetical protein
LKKPIDYPLESPCYHHLEESTKNMALMARNPSLRLRQAVQSEPLKPLLNSVSLSTSSQHLILTFFYLFLAQRTTSTW